MMVGTAQGPSPSGRQIGYMNAGPDGKIYAAVMDDNYLAVVNNPNAAGAACNLVDNGFYLDGKTRSAGICNPFVIHDFLSLNESPQPISITVFSNPSNEWIYVYSKQSPIFRLQIMDMSGRSVFEDQPHQTRQWISISHFPAGTYLLTAKTSDAGIIKKIAIAD